MFRNACPGDFASPVCEKRERSLILNSPASCAISGAGGPHAFKGTTEHNDGGTFHIVRFDSAPQTTASELIEEQMSALIKQDRSKNTSMYSVQTKAR